MFDRIQSTLAGVIAFIYMLNLPTFLYLTDRMSVTPALVFGAAALACLPIVAFRRWGRLLVDVPMLFAVAAFIAAVLVAASIAPLGSGGEAAVREYLYGGALLTMFLLLAADARCNAAMTKAIVLAIIVALPLLIFDLLVPFVLLPHASGLANPGRAAATFVNANIAGGSLAVAFALVVSRIEPRWREILAVVVALEVLMTLSRGAAVVMLMVVAVTVFARQIRARMLTAYSAFAVVLAVLGVLSIVPAATVEGLLANPSIRDRVLAPVSGDLVVEDFSLNQRELVAERAMDRIGTSPLAGSGIGATHEWDQRVSTHNLYLRFGVEFGVLGLLIFPLLVACACIPALGNATTRTSGIAVAAALLGWGMVSHNVIGEAPFALVMGLIGASAAVDPSDARRSEAKR